MADPICIWRSGCPHPDACRSAGMCVPMMQAPGSGTSMLAGLESWSLRPDLPECELSLRFNSVEHAQEAREQIRQHLMRAPDDSTEQRIHAICKLIRAHTWAGIDESKAVCHGCPAAEDTPHGPGTRGCYLLARGVFNIAAHGTRRGAP